MSHSSKDKNFIESLALDLRKCHIEPWLDTEEIRDGKSWLKVIFEDGIPTCDIVIVYLTENSINSKMVQKEMDSSLISQLSESGVSFLPYVKKAELRPTLRLDMQSLQCREWNADNYNDVLPSVVAEIWHSYLERTISWAVSQEKNKRLELELELARQKERSEESPFSRSEETNFRYIYNFLNKPCKLVFKLFEKEGAIPSHIGFENFTCTYLDLISVYFQKTAVIFEWYMLAHYITETIKAQGFPMKSHFDRYYGLSDDLADDVIINLRTFGFLRLSQDTDTHKWKDELTEKYYRFRYWLGYNSLLKEAIKFTLLETTN